MDEMRTLQDFRADAPAPDRARLAPGRQRLLDEAARPRRRLRGGWWPAVAGAAAAVTAVATLATLLPADHEPAAPAVKPRADQWIYRKTEWRMVDCGAGGSGGEGMEMLNIDLSFNRTGASCDLRTRKPYTQEAWERYDGWDEFTGEVPPAQTPSGARYGGAGSGDTLTHRQSDSLVEDLPDDTDGALRLIRKRSIPSRSTSAWRLTQGQRDFEEIAEVLATATVMPEAKGRLLFRTARKLPGATLTSTAAPGGKGALLALGVEGNYRDYSYARNTFQVLFDPETQAFRGFRLVAGIGYYVSGKESGGPYVAKGTVLATALRATTEVVDARGERS
ncbi:hypothetical protein E2C00_14770 [Streptomyces sp. WAC05374]|uniref:hypothetical protein n=1 Tax=Streptomyces sp. WAC05374 TaxID=2487420 RepID=UPI000F89CFF3|nr:hypothetical protein [Streptomyces sp. WAC05374]RST18708.1 hypothetical protein EF905_04430 [Streptomyces sp. WAC05374]TDF48337.1 hypothetical protein E2B92_05495 [Streptomyces sp. WAC05374]TDF49209.1 hypothetical protein E2C02_27015 [Streptomyces sp. WAC05374]TDF55271.1 hypothetical protein E2C00_14770 [Streptomyces sp. WAC05374]